MGVFDSGAGGGDRSDRLPLLPLDQLVRPIYFALVLGQTHTVED
jgi:hypothetical protein